MNLVIKLSVLFAVGFLSLLIGTQQGYYDGYTARQCDEMKDKGYKYEKACYEVRYR